MKIKPLEVLKPTIILAVTCLIVTALLAGTNLLTADAIENQKIMAANKARQEVLPDAAEYEECTSGEDIYYKGKDADGNVMGYVFTNSNSGYGGAISVMTGISAEGTITGVVILEHNETPGLGANAEKPSFCDQFKQELPGSGSFNVIKNAEPGAGEILALSGATISSNSVTTSVNNAIEMYNQVKEG